MPYIKTINRSYLNDLAEDITERYSCLYDQLIVAITEDFINIGDINYLCHEILRHFYIKNKYNYESSCYVQGVILKIMGEDNNETTNGMLIDLILESYRRKKAPYEDTKILENGDVHYYLGD